MTLQIVLITHGDVGQTMLKTITHTLGELPLPTMVVSVNFDANPEDLIEQLKHIALETDKQSLILTDLYGSTPCNIAQALNKAHNIRVVSGLNLPMLIRVMNYAQLDLISLADKALSGGKEGVINCEKNL